MDKRVKILLTLLLLIALAAVFYLITGAITKYTGYSITGNLAWKDKEKTALAICLTNKNAVLYGFEGREDFEMQRSLFGDGFGYIKYIDCRTKSVACRSLSDYLAWQINGRIYYGIQDLSRLENLSNCKIR